QGDLEGQVTMLHERRQHQTKLPWQAFGMLVKWHETFPGQSKIRAQGRSHVTRIYARKVLVPRSAGVWPPGAATHATSLRRTDACCVERAPADRRWPLKMPGSAIRSRHLFLGQDDQKMATLPVCALSSRGLDEPLPCLGVSLSRSIFSRHIMPRQPARVGDPPPTPQNLAFCHTH